MIDIDVEQTLGDFLLQAKFCVDAPVVGVFGRSGAGKSSLINAIAGVTRPRRGHVRIDGVTLFDHASGVDLSPPRRRVGYVFQDALLFPHLSVNTNLMYGHRLRPASARYIEPARVIEVLGIGALLQRGPDTLSGGERQRVAIGRALLAQPRVLLLDEPLASLDQTRKNEILDYIDRLRDEFHIPIVYVSHSIAEITRLADAVVVIADGKCVAVGDVDTIMGRLDIEPIAGNADRGAIIETTVVAHDGADQLTTLGFVGGELIVPRLDVAIGKRVRAHIRARDVSLAVQRPVGISILNILCGRVTGIREEGGAVVDVQLAVGDATLVARITQRSLAQLGIREQQDVHALVKSVSFDRLGTGYV